MIDSHAHLTSSQLVTEADAILHRAVDAGVRGILNICTDAESLQKGLCLAQRWPHVKNSGATPPHDAEPENDPSFVQFYEAAKGGLLAAIGETGLDYHKVRAPRETQQQYLISYLHVATECQLPIIFHCRNAFSDLFTLCDREYPAEGKAIIHCFTGTWDEAKRALDRGWWLSFSGIITFPNSASLREIVTQVPLSQMLVETDAPYLAPQSRRGQQNEPAYLREIIELIATLKKLSFDEVEAATENNCRQLFQF